MERNFVIDSSESFNRAVDRPGEYVRVLKGLAHPIRLAVLVSLSRGDLSPSQFARSRGEPVSNVSYHFRVLAALGLIELARTRPVRGSVEHIYRRIAPNEATEIKLGLARESHVVLTPADLVALIASGVLHQEIGHSWRADITTSCAPKKVPP